MMKRGTKPRPHDFMLELSGEEKAMLIAIAERDGLKLAQAVRLMIRAEHQKMQEGEASDE